VTVQGRSRLHPRLGYFRLRDHMRFPFAHLQNHLTHCLRAGSIAWRHGESNELDAHPTHIELDRRRFAEPPYLAGQSSQVLKRFDPWNEEVCAALYGGKCRKTLYLLPDGTLGNRKVKRPILAADHRIMLIPELVEIWIVDPNVLDEFELADEACADHKRCNAALPSVLGRPFR
jgi:hypothetical protein